MSSHSFRYSFHGNARTWTLRNECKSPENSTTAFARDGNDVSEVPHENLDTGNIKWSATQLMRLLYLYRAHACLWDKNNPNNRCRESRKVALIDITEAMGGNATLAEISQKIQILRSTYRYEKRCIKERIRKGIGAKTKLKWYALAHSFLNDANSSGKDKDEDIKNEPALVDAVGPIIDPASESNEFSQSKEIHINLESEEKHSNLNNNGVSMPPQIVKAELKSTIESEGILLENRKWTSHDSLRLVFILRSYPLFWQLAINESKATYERSQEYERAIEEISRTMQMPKQRLQKRLQSFRSTYKLELEKIEKDNNYKPNIMWWPMVEEFLLTQKQMLINKNQASENHTLLNENEALDRSISDAILSTNMGDISPPPPPPPNIEDSSSISDSSYMHRQNYINPPMKLIWDGLEDNLLEGKWSLRHSVKFLRLYGAHRCLWDLHNPNYRSREMRSAALEDIAAAMGYGLDVDYVAKKIKIFRITYMQHRKRMIEDMKENRKPNINLRWFPLADSFLRPHIGLRSIKKQERELPQFDYQYVYTNLNLIDPDLMTDLTMDCS